MPRPLWWFLRNIVFGLGCFLFVCFVEGYVGIYLILMNHAVNLPPEILARIPFDVSFLTNYAARIPAFWTCGWISLLPFCFFCGWLNITVQWDPWMNKIRIVWCE